MPLDAKDLDSLKGKFGISPHSQVSGQDIIAETLPRRLVTLNNIAIAASGTIMVTAIYIPADVTVSTLNFASGSTAEATGTHAWMALYRPGNPAVTGDLRLLGQSTNDTGAAAIGANVIFTKTLATPIKITGGGLHYIGISVTATAMPTAAGATATNAGSGFLAITPWVTATGGTALAGVAPDPMPALSASTAQPYLYVT